jgi:urease accessory protein
MLITQKLGNTKAFEAGNRTIDKLLIEWYEANKRILHKQSVSGQKVTLQFLQQNPELKDGDVLFETPEYMLVVEILACECVVMEPKNMAEAAAICYEIGNKHLPLFIDANQLLIPYDAPLYVMLQAYGYVIQREERKLIHPLKTSVSPHGTTSSNSLFNRIMKLTSS